MKRKKMTEADRERLEQARRNSEWLRELAEKGKADLERRKQIASRPADSSGLDSWQVTLTTGEVLDVRAHAFRKTQGSYVFMGLVEGTPAHEYELLRIPTNAVAELVVA